MFKLKDGKKAFSAFKISAAAIGALAVGATAFGALAIGSAAVGILKIGKAKLGKLRIDDLSVKKNNSGEVGRRKWIIPEGYIPSESTGPEPQLISHETACILNANDQEANIEITVYFGDKEPVGPYKISVPAKRTNHVRFNNLKDPEPIPLDTDYASIIISDIPVVVQHTRLDSRQAENALISTIAYPAE